MRPATHSANCRSLHGFCTQKGHACLSDFLQLTSNAQEVSKVFLGASAVLSNGTVISRVGAAAVAMLAASRELPVGRTSCSDNQYSVFRTSEPLSEPLSLPAVPSKVPFKVLPVVHNIWNLESLTLPHHIHADGGGPIYSHDMLFLPKVGKMCLQTICRFRLFRPPIPIRKLH